MSIVRKKNNHEISQSSCPIKLRATFSGISDFAGIPDPPLTLHTCSSEVVSRDALSSTGAIKSESGIALFGRLSNAYDPRLFRMLLEAKKGAGAVAVPVAFLSYPGQDLFAPIVKDREMIGFAGTARESLTLSGNLMINNFRRDRHPNSAPSLYLSLSLSPTGVALPVSYLKSLPSRWSVYDLNYNADIVAKNSEEIMIYHMATRYVPTHERVSGSFQSRFVH